MLTAAAVAAATTRPDCSAPGAIFDDAGVDVVSYLRDRLGHPFYGSCCCRDPCPLVHVVLFHPHFRSDHFVHYG